MNYLNIFNLTGKVAVVTGGAGLLGQQHCLALLESGAKVYLTDLNNTLMDEAIDIIKTEYPDSNIHKLTLDVTNEKSIEYALNTILDQSGKVDILVNNAAIDPKVKSASDKNLSRLENFDLEDWNLQLNVGLTGAFLCSKIFGSSMAKNSSGIILNIASDLAVIAPDQRIYKKENLSEDQQPVKPVTYSVIKTGLIGLTRYLATYWADKNIRVNAISPGGVFNNHPASFTDKLTPLIPLGRMAHKDEYRGLVQFLCSDASSYMTGQNIIADGGRSVW